MNFDDIFS